MKPLEKLKMKLCKHQYELVKWSYIYDTGDGRRIVLSDWACKKCGREKMMFPPFGSVFEKYCIEDNPDKKVVGRE